jgi:integrase
MPRRTPYVFATPASSGHVASGTWLKKLRTHWGVTVHGKRSTFADWAVENEVCSPATADAVLDHETRKKVTRAYQRYDLLNQRRAILQQWANFVTGREVEMYEDALGLKSELDKT